MCVRRLVWAGYVWLGVMFLLLTIVVSSDLLRCSRSFGRRLRPPSRSTRSDERSSRGCSAALSGVLVSGLAAVGLRSVRKPVDVRRVRVRLGRLPLEQHGFRIVQLTDIHVGPDASAATFIEEIVARTNALGPDSIAITGDLVDGAVDELRDRRSRRSRSCARRTASSS